MTSSPSLGRICSVQDHSHRVELALGKADCISRRLPLQLSPRLPEAALQADRLIVGQGKGAEPCWPASDVNQHCSFVAAGDGELAIEQVLLLLTAAAVMTACKQEA